MHDTSFTFKAKQQKYSCLNKGLAYYLLLALMNFQFEVRALKLSLHTAPSL